MSIYPSEMKGARKLAKSMTNSGELTEHPWIYRYEGINLPEGHHYLFGFNTRTDKEKFVTKWHGCGDDPVRNSIEQK